MDKRTIPTDSTLREDIVYRDPSFPHEICIDDYSTLVDNTLNCHWHSEYEYVYLKEGRLDYYLNGNRYSLRPGDLLLVGSSVMHTGIGDKEENAVALITVLSPQIMSLGIDGSIYSKFFQPLQEARFEGVLFRPGAESSAIIESILALHALDKDSYLYELDCLSLFVRLWRDTLDYFSRHGSDIVLEHNVHSSSEDGIRRIISYIKENYQQPISISSLASAAGMSRSSLFRTFPLFTSRTPAEYINEYRLTVASALLRSSSLPVSAISERCGFSSLSYFSRLFREKYGTSPLQYRRGISSSRL